MKLSRVLVILILLAAAAVALSRYRQGGAALPARPAETSQAPAIGPGDRSEPSLELAGLPTRGSVNAKVVLVEFSDYECPYCARHTHDVAPELDRRFVQTGLVRYAFANNPLPFHNNATLLAVSAICAGDQDRYWEMHARLFAEKARTKPELISMASSLGLDAARFQQCLEDSPAPEKRIQADMLKAQELQMNGTPGFAIGVADAAGRVTVRKIIMGAQPLAVFNKALEQVLSEGTTERF